MKFKILYAIETYNLLSLVVSLCFANFMYLKFFEANYNNSLTVCHIHISFLVSIGEGTSSPSSHLTIDDCMHLKFH